MRITGPNGTALSTKSGSARRTAAGGFSLNETETPRSTAGAGPMRSVASLDGLLALQGVETPTERKKRAVVRGRKALDVLDDLKLGLLDGSLDSATIDRLKLASEGLAEDTGDAGLDDVLSAIDLRVAVELAKAGRR
ncbi:MAG: flagellar assembly regulator FliX [Rhodopseudomonas sp.]|nr:flagellar assembly regulator FliX [Rhodopseudomonas sp.]